MDRFPVHVLTVYLQSPGHAVNPVIPYIGLRRASRYRRLAEGRVRKIHGLRDFGDRACSCGRGGRHPRLRPKPLHHDLVEPWFPTAAHRGGLASSFIPPLPTDALTGLSHKPDYSDYQI